MPLASNPLADLRTPVRTPIIPVSPRFVGEAQTLDLEAICVFAALGFFLDQDSYCKEVKALRPAHTYDTYPKPVGTPWFTWHYEPRDITLRQAVNEFADLFEAIIDEQTGSANVILPLSGGLDSRTQAAALAYLKKDVHAFGYRFERGLDETYYSSQIARRCGFAFENWVVPKGYLWREVDRLATVTGCYSEFTHPRQMAFLDRYAALGEVFSVGHWGDVLFDDMHVPDDLAFDDQVSALLGKIVKPGGLELARALWQAWAQPGHFDDYLRERITALLHAIPIPHSANARIRAFKSLYWATRWTAVNLAIFQSVRPVTAPYFDDRMCQFICTVPERWLAGRQIQVEYVKRRSPELARVPWQEHRPFNLYTYSWNKMPYQLPYVVWWKLKSKWRKSKMIQRNWELQFVGEDNDKHLRERLFDNAAFSDWIPKNLTKRLYNSFLLDDPVKYSHSVSILLTLSQFMKITFDNKPQSLS